MNVRHIDKFIEDIDEKKLKDWQWEQDCHEKVRKITLYKEWALREIPVKETVQLTLEHNPHFNPRHPSVTAREQVRKMWVIDEKLSKKIVKKLSKEFDYPIKTDYEEFFHNGERL